MKPGALTAIALVLVPLAATAQVIRTSQIQSPPVQLYEFDTTDTTLEVVSTGALKTTEMRPNEGVSVRNALQLPAVSGWAQREMLLVSGGKSGSSSDRPDGLLVSGGRIASWSNLQRLPADAKSRCALRQTSRLRLSGLVCVDAANRVSIGKLTDETASYENCRQAIQSGPLLVEGGKASVCERDAGEGAAMYSVVCMREGTRMAIAVTLSPVPIDDLAAWLAGAGPAGAGCVTAMVLSSGNASGALYSAPQSYQLDGRRPRHAGPGSVPVASYVVVRRTEDLAVPASSRSGGPEARSARR
nr:phosphodiester glycosidase family protein [uncultured Roseateles sp.]